MSILVVWHCTCMNDHGIVDHNLKCIAPPLYHSPSQSSARSLDLTRGSQIGHRTFSSVPRPHHWISLSPPLVCMTPGLVSPETCPICVSFDFAVPCSLIPLGNCSHPSREVWVISLEKYTKGAWQACQSWSIGYGYFLSLPIIHNAIRCCLPVAEPSFTSSSADTCPSWQITCRK